MKRNILYLSLCLALVALLFFPSCEPEGPTAEEEFLAQIGTSWQATSVDVDGVFINGAFDGFSINITEQKTFTTTNGNDPIWPPSGTFTLQESSTAGVFNLLRDDGVLVTVSELTEGTVVLEFDYDAPGGRTKSVSGHYTFELQN